MSELTTITQKVTKYIAPLALALAVITANSTCICFSNQPTPPEQLSKFRKYK